MSSSLIFDVEYETTDSNTNLQKWNLLKGDIGVFAHHQLRDFLYDCKTGYDLIMNINDQTMQKLKALSMIPGLSDEKQEGLFISTKVLYLSQIDKLVEEIEDEEHKFFRMEDEENSSYPEEEIDRLREIRDAVKSLRWIVNYLYDERFSHYPIIDETIRIIFYWVN